MRPSVKEEIDLVIEKNKEKINDIIQLEKNYKKYVLKEVDKLGLVFDDLNNDNITKKRRMYFIKRKLNSKKVRELYIRIDFSTLFKSENKIEVSIQIKNSALKKFQDNYDDFVTSLPRELKLSKDKVYKSSNYFDILEYEFLVNNDDILNLSDFIVKKIDKTGINKAFKHIEDKLNPLKEDKV